MNIPASLKGLTAYIKRAEELDRETSNPDSKIIAYFCRTFAMERGMKLNAVGLRGARDLMPSEISGGMARRVALARAIALDPELIMYDEPFAGLDPISLGTAAQLIRRLNDSLGLTSVIITHHVRETLEVADRALVVANQGIVFHGTPAELMQTTDPLLRQFLEGQPDGPIGFDYRRQPVRDAGAARG